MAWAHPGNTARRPPRGYQQQQRRQPRHGKKRQGNTTVSRRLSSAEKRASACQPLSSPEETSRGGLEGSGGVAARRWYPALAFIPLGYGIPAAASWSESEHAFVRRREPCRLKTRWCWLCWYGVGKLYITYPSKSSVVISRAGSYPFGFGSSLPPYQPAFSVHLCKSTPLAIPSIGFHSPPLVLDRTDAWDSRVPEFWIWLTGL